MNRKMQVQFLKLQQQQQQLQNAKNCKDFFSQKQSYDIVLVLY